MPTIYIQNIHVLNFPLLWLLSFFTDVHVFRNEAYLNRYLSRFKIHFFESDEQYFDLLEKAYWYTEKVLLEKYSSNVKKEFPRQYHALIMQRNSIDVENYFYFLETYKTLNAKRKKQSSIIQPCQTLNTAEMSFFGHSFICFLNILDFIYYRIYQTTKALSMIKLFVFSKFQFSISDNLKAKYLFSDYSIDRDVAKQDDERDFVWIVGEGKFNKNESLFLFDSPLGEAITKRYRDQGVRVVSRVEAYSVWTIKDLFHVLVDTFTCIIKIWITNDLSQISKVKIDIENAFSRVLYNHIKPEVLIETCSSMLPESSELVLCKELGIKSAKWFYSTNEFNTSSLDRKYSDYWIRGGIVATDEMWMWNESCTKTYKRRNFAATFGLEEPLILTVGPMMQGNHNSLRLSKESLRKKIINKTDGFFITLFDFPFFTLDVLRSITQDNLTTFDEQEKLLIFVKMILDKYPNVNLIVKPKKDFSQDQLSSSTVFQELYNDKSKYLSEGRLFVLDRNIDPYIPIGLADFCISTPLSSAILAAIEFKRKVLFFDPRGRYNSRSEFLLEYPRFQSNEDGLRMFEEILSEVLSSEEPKLDEYLNELDSRINKAIQNLISRPVTSLV